MQEYQYLDSVRALQEIKEAERLGLIKVDETGKGIIYMVNGKSKGMSAQELLRHTETVARYVGVEVDIRRGDDKGLLKALCPTL